MLLSILSHQSIIILIKGWVYDLGEFKKENKKGFLEWGFWIEVGNAQNPKWDLWGEGLEIGLFCAVQEPTDQDKLVFQTEQLLLLLLLQKQAFFFF